MRRACCNILVLLAAVSVMLLIAPADCRSCDGIRKELTVNNTRNPWRYNKSPPRCRIQIGSESNPLDLDRIHAASLTHCIRACHKDASCQALTYSYNTTGNLTDNCWLKIAVTITQRTNDSASNVSWVSLFKPSPYAVDHNTTEKDCAKVKEELQKYHDKDWNSQQPLCRVDFQGNADLLRYNNVTLAGCIDHCNAVPACKGITYNFGAPGEDYDNCWLKGNINTTVITQEDSKHVMYVSLTKPVKEKTCFDDSKCKTGFILGTVGTVLGLIATLGNIVGSLAHWKDETMPNVFRRAASAAGKSRELTSAFFTVKSQKKIGQPAIQV